MSRSYKRIRPKKHFVYSVDDLICLYDVHRNTVTRWVAEGLRTSDDALPYVFNGTEVKRFHDTRRLTSITKLRIGEFKCFGCKKRVFPEPSSVSVPPSEKGFFSVWGACPNCGRVVTKRVNETDCDKIKNCVYTNTTLASLDEGNVPVSVSIGNNRHPETKNWSSINDRTLHAWLQFAGRWDSKTISAKLAAIREFEVFCDRKPFQKIAVEDATRFRDHLKSSVEATEETRKSISTVRHCASHLKSFFEWLVDQKGFSGLNRSLPRNFDLPKKFEANGLGGVDRAVPSDEQAVAMVGGMATHTLKARRDRAMVAIAFLAALRADTVTSLRVKHVDILNCVIIQDAETSRTKNGKSLRINWFPVPSIFADVVQGWLKELVELGFTEEDALFPDERHLQQRTHSDQTQAVPVMNSTHAIAVAFRSASAVVGQRFSPHSAKHYIGALGLTLCKTVEEQAAWSANMGHEGMEITHRYYQKMTQSHVDDVFERFHQPARLDVPQDDMFLMMRYHFHGLTKGTQEFEQAAQLVSEHEKNRTFD